MGNTKGTVHNGMEGKSCYDAPSPLPTSAANQTEDQAWQRQQESVRHEQEIRCVEQRLQEQKLSAADRERYGEPSGACGATDYKIWLLHERDKISYLDIGKVIWPDVDPEITNMRARRAWEKVEWELGRAGHRKKPYQPFDLPLLRAAVAGVFVARSHDKQKETPLEMNPEHLAS